MTVFQRWLSLGTAQRVMTTHRHQATLACITVSNSNRKLTSRMNPSMMLQTKFNPYNTGILAKCKCCSFPITSRFLSSEESQPPEEVLIKVIEHIGGRSSPMTLAEAEGLATKKSLKLVLVDHPEGSVPIYQLVHDKHHKHGKVKLKNLKIVSKIAKHDLDIKLEHLHQWLLKGVPAKVVIIKSRNDEKDAENVFNSVSEIIKDIARVKQVQTSLKEIVISIEPIEDDDKSKSPSQKPLKMAEIEKQNRAKDK